MELFNDQLYKVKLEYDSPYLLRQFKTNMSMTEAKKYYTSLLSAIDSTKCILPIKEWQLRKGKIYELVPQYQEGSVRVDDFINLVTKFNKKGYTNSNIKKQNLGYYNDKLVFIKSQGIHKIKKNENLKDVEFLRQTLVDIIFNNESGDYEAILKRHKHEEQFEKLPKMIESGDFMKIYKLFIQGRQEYLNDDTFKSSSNIIQNYTQTVKPIDLYTQSIIKQSPWIDPSLLPMINPVYTPIQPIQILQPVQIQPPPEINNIQLPPFETPLINPNPEPGQPYGGAKTTNRKKPKDVSKGSVINDDFEHKVYKEYHSPFFLDQ